MKYLSTKTYDHIEGMSCSFRQWRAESHCNRIHGYSLSVKFVFGATNLDERNWVVDFGGLKDVKTWLKDMFDHTCCVADDDPELEVFKELEERGLISLRIVPGTGCEKFAELIYRHVDPLIQQQSNGRCFVQSVEVREHGGNSALVEA
jgi:6-pyruvoyltetrahydropterin/6-carboxytetrahydropterin synthase